MDIDNLPKIGESLDLGVVYRINSDGVAVSLKLKDITDNSRVVFFGGPAPFSRLDTEQAIMYANMTKEMLEYVDHVYAIYAQDFFVCKEFEKKILATTNTNDLIILADGDGFFIRNARLDYDFTYQGLGVRSQRWSAVVNNGVIEYFALDDFSEINVTKPEDVLDYLKG